MPFWSLLLILTLALIALAALTLAHALWRLAAQRNPVRGRLITVGLKRRT